MAAEGADPQSLVPAGAAGDLHSDVQELVQGPNQLVLQNGAADGDGVPTGYPLDVDVFRDKGPYTKTEPSQISTDPPTHVPVLSEPAELRPCSTVALMIEW